MGKTSTPTSVQNSMDAYNSAVAQNTGVQGYQNLHNNVNSGKWDTAQAYGMGQNYGNAQTNNALSSGMFAGNNLTNNAYNQGSYLGSNITGQSLGSGMAQGKCLE